ncbi:MAG: hypothetical protein M3417_07815 [Actinomycetota bacterium]|nr:hypothetical protein [Actinomycetota bacterium]
MPKRVVPCLVLIAMTLATPAQAAFPGANGRISFSSQGDLWTVAADGSRLTRLTATPEEEAQSAFSPDGTRIAYRRRPAGGAPFQVYVMEANGADQRRVSASAVNETQPAWSPDGRQLVYRRSIPGDPNAEIWAMGADGTGARPLVTSPGADERYPVFSPDGTRLAFTSSRDSQYEIYVSAADGSAPVRLTTDPDTTRPRRGPLTPPGLPSSAAPPSTPTRRRTSGSWPPRARDRRG